jgi:hypothetical protein
VYELKNRCKIVFDLVFDDTHEHSQLLEEKLPPLQITRPHHMEEEREHLMGERVNIPTKGGNEGKGLQCT